MSNMSNKDKVVFRVFPEGDVVAIFPEIDADKNGNVSSYQRIGQHGPCSPELIKGLRAAKLKEYKALKQELESIGYKLEVLK